MLCLILRMLQYLEKKVILLIQLSLSSLLDYQTIWDNPFLMIIIEYLPLVFTIAISHQLTLSAPIVEEQKIFQKLLSFQQHPINILNYLSIPYLKIHFVQKLYIPGTICGSRIQEISQQLNIPKGYEDITYCMDEEYIKQNPEIRIQGSTRQDNFTLLGALQQIQILVIYSAKMSEQHGFQQQFIIKLDCAPIEDINQYIVKLLLSTNDQNQMKYIKNANLYYSYSFHQFNKELDDSPYEKAQNIDVTPMYYKVRKYIKIYFQYSQSQLEYNPFYFFPSYVQHDGFEYQNTGIDSALNFEDDSSFAQLEINLDAKKRIHFITYQTLMDVAAKIGGFFTIIRVIFDIVLFPIQSILYRLYLINCITHQQNNVNTNTSDTPKNKTNNFLTFYRLIKSGKARYN